MTYEECEWVAHVLTTMLEDEDAPETKEVIKLIYKVFSKHAADEILSVARAEASVGGRGK